MSDKSKLEALTRMIMEELSGAQRRDKPKLRLVDNLATPTAIVDTEDDEITRASRISRIRWLAKSYKLDWLVEQHCFTVPGVESLNPESLRSLHKDMERARECIAEGISFDEVGLVRNTSFQESA